MLETEVLMFIVFGVMWIICSAGIAAFVTYTILNKWANFGDSTPSMYEYTLQDIDYIRSRDRVPTTDKRFLFDDYGENPFEGKKHRIPEPLLKGQDELEM